MNRILFVAHLADLSGAQQVLLDVIDALDRSRDIPEVIVPAEGPFVQALRERAIAYRIIDNPVAALSEQQNPIRQFQLTQQRVNYIAQLRRHMIATRPRLVFINTMVNPYAGIAARLAGVHTVYYVHEIFPRTVLNRIKYATVERCADRILGPSHANAAMFSGAAQRKKFHQLPYGIDAARFIADPTRRSTARSRLHYSEQEVVIGTVCFITPRKGVDDFLKAAAILHREAPNTRFLVAGSADPHAVEYYQHLHNYVQQQGLDAVVQFVPHTNAVEDIYAALDIFALASLSESTPRVILEAMAASVPVVATSVGGVPEMFDSEESGILVEPRKPEQLAQAILRLVKDDHLRQFMAAKAFEKIETNNNMAKFREAVQKIVSETYFNMQ